MNILVVNDDGVHAVGIRKLALSLRKYGHVIVCGPDTGRSASSHSILLHSPVRFDFLEKKDQIEWYSTNGMPADCVRLAVALLDRQIDVVFSGINDGLNIGTDIIYSGTVAAAREAQIEGIPAIAISTDFKCFQIVDQELDALLGYIFQKKLYSKEYVLNVNFPISEFSQSRGYRFCRQGIKKFTPVFIKNEQGAYCEENASVVLDTHDDTDVYLSTKGYITFVPLQVEQTLLEKVEDFKKMA